MRCGAGMHKKKAPRFLRRQAGVLPLESDAHTRYCQAGTRLLPHQPVYCGDQNQVSTCTPYDVPLVLLPNTPVLESALPGVAAACAASFHFA